MLIKTRRAKNSTRGIYLQDKQIGETIFQVGTHYKYVVDVANNKMVILASDDGNTVSKREMNNTVKPVLDIRNKQALSAFQGCEYLQIEIFEDQIVVSGFVSETKSVTTAVKKFISQKFKKTQKVHDITDLLQVKQKARIVLSKEQLNKAVGGYEQLSFSFTEEEVKSHSSVQYIESALQHLQVAFQVDSLFSGAGLMDLGFIKEGFDISLAVEIDTDAVKTYRANHGEHVLEADIDKLAEGRFSSPVMIGGPPCQGLSNSNRYTNYLDNPNNKFIRSYIDAIKTNKNCKVFVLENVPQLLTAGNGTFKEEILEQLSDFEITCDILNATDYGSPQARKRAIFIGSKIGKINLPDPTQKKGILMTVRDAIRGLSPFTANQQDISKSRPETLARIQSVPPGGNVHDIPEGIRPSGTHSDMYKRLEWDKPSITIVNPRKSMLLHPEEDRILSVRECARIQGLPDDYVFHGTLNARQQQVANGVPVQLTQAIAKVIHHAIEKFNIRNRIQPSFC